MPFYSPLRHLPADVRARAVAGLQALRAQARATGIPKRTLKDTLLLATWNIRDFGNEDKRAQDGLNQPGPRLEESYYYIAEIIANFDLVAIQEVNSLEALKRVIKILGPSWDYMTTDISPGKAGNEERMTFVFDTRKVRFQNIAGQIVTDRPRQFVRPPYYAAFQSGWFKFSLCTVHILYGDFRDTTARIAEIDEIAAFLSERALRTDENIILLGDFNILSREDPTFAPFGTHGWTVPLDYRTDVEATQAYDQIAFKMKEGEVRRGPSVPNSGVFEPYKSVFTDREWEAYHAIATATGRPMTSWDGTLRWPENDRILSREEYFRVWRTWQISDHMPLWLELEIDFADDYLKRLGAPR